LILQRQIEQRGERRKCLDADIRLSCQKPGLRACRPVEHPGRHFKPRICSRLFQRAAEDDKAILVDGTMNANSATKPRVMPIKNLAKNGPVGVLKPRSTTTSERTGRRTKMLRSRAKFSEPEASNHAPSLVAFTTITPELKFLSTHRIGLEAGPLSQWLFIWPKPSYQ
jgi:hypothetical protein